MGKCQICGKSTKFNFPLCTDCNNKKEQGLICQDENGKWTVKEEPKKPATEDKSSELTCLICGKPSNGKHFCLDCWKEYKDKAIDIRIKNCQETEILDKYGNKTNKCLDGYFVRSRAEVMISDWLYNKGKRVSHEPEFYYKNEKGETKELHPDFYLPDYDIYIEYCELQTKPYLKKQDYVMKIYKENNKKVLIMTNKDIDNRDKFFFEKLDIK